MPETRPWPSETLEAPGKRRANLPNAFTADKAEVGDELKLIRYHCEQQVANIAHVLHARIIGYLIPSGGGFSK